MIRKTYFEIAAFFEFPTWKFKLPGNSNEKKNISLAENSIQAHAYIILLSSSSYGCFKILWKSHKA